MNVTGEVEFTGRIQALTLPAVNAHPTFKVQVVSDDDLVELVFVGHRHLPGFRVGRNLTARGKLLRSTRQVMYNPIYWLKADDL
ncbi:MAG: hypothetical protein QMB98_02570 [Flaviflexus sp.]|uniref:hypothetical protein n=1 Tax=Flaviflexus sp. TaxID=1969482 RepID=UPI00352DC52B